MSRHVLVTGGAGFIGSHLVERLVTAGDRTSVVDDLSRGRRDWLNPEVELHELDLRDAGAVERVVGQLSPDVVVHLAALHFIPAVEGAPELARDVNVNATTILLDALATAPPELLLFASTAAVYPDRRSPIAETCPPRPFDLYGRTKLKGERLVAEFAARTGTRCIVARIFNVIGRRETNRHVVPELVGQLRRKLTPVRLGNLEPRRDYTDVVDVSEALHRLLSLPPHGPDTLNVGSGRSVSVDDLVKTCERILGRPIDVAVAPERLRTRDRAELVADPSLIRDATGWKPLRPLERTLAELLTD
ncbi:MAG: NAD-dependent epimerase/dehydratase family protein [Actinobacteria bacterium]|nr:NAD-dependent epimerase/dehydratase family protein [Actinomycetota bacterium]